MTSIIPPLRAHMTSLTPAWEGWQARVPEMLEESRQRWGLEVGEKIASRVTSSLYRVRARGRDAVLKLALPGEHFQQQANLLEKAKGQGCVHLFAHDAELGAMLMEPLGASIESRGEALYGALPSGLVLPMIAHSELIAPVVETLKVVWELPHDLVEVPTDTTHKAAQLRDLIDNLADKLGVRDQHAEAIARARLYAEHRLSAREASFMVVCHGDPHPGNLLQVLSPRPGAPAGYVWVDPDGFLCEAEYDLGVVLRGFNTLVLAADDPVVTLRSWCAVLADATDTDAEAIWQWALIERVTSGLYLMDHGRPERGRRFLEAATWLISRRNA